MLTTGEVAKLFHVSAQTVINWLDQGRLPYERIGKGPRRLTEASVLKYIQDIGISTEALDGDIYESILKKSTAQIESHVAPLVVVDKDARIIAWNEGATELFGYNSMDMISKPVDKLPTRVDGTGSGLEYTIRSPWQGSCLDLKAKHESKAGIDISTSVSVSKFFGQANVKAGYILLFQEISI
jgi:excisionase family DNA binding protein/PAS domain S-box-containing protein